MNKYEIKRQALIAEILANENDPGRHGKAFELSCARSLSKKDRVSAQGKFDNYIRFSRNGKDSYVGAEAKTNGGRVEALLSGENKAKFVIYRLTTVQKHKATKSTPAWVEPRVVPALIIPTALFLQMLKECNALKEMRHGGIVDGIGIQPTSKKMYERLTAYGENYPDLLFDREAIYEDWMFEGLEL